MGNKSIGQIIIRCLDVDPQKRPSLEEISKAINGVEIDI